MSMADSVAAEAEYGTFQAKCEKAFGLLPEPIRSRVLVPGPTVAVEACAALPLSQQYRPSDSILPY